MRRLTSTLKRLAPALLAPALLLVLSACSEDAGPIEIKYDRDACEMCGMIISSPRFAAELRLASDNRPHKFDDIGDAMNWLEQQCLDPDKTKEIWVMNSTDGKTWLDARRAWYRRARSPMNYDFEAVAAMGEGTVDFAAMRAKVLQARYACARKGEGK